jgi:divalent metal cation (Fe/Co/Zn/Cd) transporter
MRVEQNAHQCIIKPWRVKKESRDSPLASEITSTTAPQFGDRAGAVQDGVRIERVTLVWMTVEAVAAIWSGVAAGSVLLTAFGIDSIIELLTGGVLLWRLLAEAGNHSLERVEWAENRAAWVTAVSLALLCLYIVVSAGVGLLTRSEPGRSYVGMAIAVIAVVGMPVLARRKREIAGRIGSDALRGDAACSIVCAYMAATMLIGLGLNALCGWWWADSLAALALLFWLQGEARETLEAARAGRGGCGCDCDD